MARIIVVDDKDSSVMDEYASPAHLEDPHHAEQIMERLRWAVRDAEGLPPMAITDYRLIPRA